MARRVKDLAINDAESRDNGKTFVLTEMSSEAAEWWALRVLQALASSEDVDLSAPLAQMAAAGLKAMAKLDPEKARPLLVEMMQCVTLRLPDGTARQLFPQDIEEVKTRIILRQAIFALHVDFFTPGGA